MTKNEPCDCDSYHTFAELYQHRCELFITLCRCIEAYNEIVNSETNTTIDILPWRSKVHEDRTAYPGYFIMGINIREGEQISYHLPLSEWNKTDFAITLEHAPAWDGHTADDVLARLAKLMG
jgi:hypothetical protein